MIAGNFSGSSPKRYLEALEEFFWKKKFEILWAQKGEILAFFFILAIFGTLSMD